VPEPAASCLDDTAVAMLVDGGLAPAARAGIERHLDACAACREMVAALARRDGGAGPGADAATRDERGGRAKRAKGAELAPGETVGRYVIAHPIGRGGMGTVYLARDPSLDRRVAIKLLRSSALDHDAQVRLLREAQAMAKVDHPNVIAVYDIGEHDGQVFLALEYVAGGNLRKWLARKRSWREIVRVFLAAGRGLAAVHAAGMVHRDFKPDNVLLGEDGSVHVGDFGLVSPATGLGGAASAASLTTSDLDVSLTATGVVVGTPAYMAPEQYLGEPVDARSDQFAFCAALFEALYGVRPFEGEDINTLSSAILSGTMRTVPRGDVPRALHALVMRGLRRSPGERHASMRAVLAELQRIAGHRRRTAAAIGGAAGVVALGIVIGFVVVRGRRSSATAPAAVASPCAGAGQELAGVWDPARRDAAGAQFATAGVAYAADTWTRVATELDAYAAAWTRSQREACEATHVRHTQSEAVMAARMSCLADRKARLRVVADQLAIQTEDTVALVTGAPRLVAALPTVASCDRLTEPEVALAPPAAKWDQIAPIEDELRKIEAVIAFAGTAPIETLDALVEKADATGFAPLRARALKQLGILLLGDPATHAEALDVLAEAVQLADEGRDDKTRAETLGLLALDSVQRLDRLSARGLVETWRAALVRSGADPEVEMLYVMCRGFVEMLEGELDALEDDAAKIDALLAASAADFAQRADWLVLFGLAATEYAPPARQLAHAQQLLETAKRELGPVHPQTLEVELLVGSALYYLHRYAEAEPILKNIVAHADTPGYEIGDEHIALGALYRETGRYADAEREFALEAEDPMAAQTGQVEYQRGLLALEQGKPGKAIELFEKTQAAFALWLPPEHPFVAQVWTALAAAERARGKFAVALDHAERARSLLGVMDGQNHRTAEALAEVGLNAAAIGRRDAAIEALEGAIVASEYGSILPRHLAEVRVALARLVAAEDPDRALALARAAATAVEGGKAQRARKVAADAAALLAKVRPR
jgi:tRNA A-37 threonylcarbamoyl transferase component Bud32/tetratricopeptide (TPR) repeat protein